MTTIGVTWDAPRLLGLGATLATIPLLLLSVRAMRRPAPVQAARDRIRLAVSAAGIVVMAVVTEVSTAGWLIALALAGGLALGFGQGRGTEPARTGDTGDAVVVRTSVVGIVVWGSGVVVMQVAGVASRAGAVELGQTVSWFGVGVLAGLLLGRSRRLHESGLAPIARAGAALLVLGAALMAGSSAGGAAPSLRSAHPEALLVGRLGADIDQDALCDLLPGIDEGFVLPLKYSYYGCFTNSRGTTRDPTYVVAEIEQLGDLARTRIDRRLASGEHAPVPGLGEASSERIGGEGFDGTGVDVAFSRGPLYVRVAAAARADAIRIALGIDARIQGFPSGGAPPTSPPIAPPLFPTTPSETVDGPDEISSSAAAAQGIAGALAAAGIALISAANGSSRNGRRAAGADDVERCRAEVAAMDDEIARLEQEQRAGRARRDAIDQQVKRIDAAHRVIFDDVHLVVGGYQRAVRSTQRNLTAQVWSDIWLTASGLATASAAIVAFGQHMLGGSAATVPTVAAAESAYRAAFAAGKSWTELAPLLAAKHAAMDAWFKGVGMMAGQAFQALATSGLLGVKGVRGALGLDPGDRQKTLFKDTMKMLEDLEKMAEKSKEMLRSSIELVDEARRIEDSLGAAERALGDLHGRRASRHAECEQLAAAVRSLTPAP